MNSGAWQATVPGVTDSDTTYWEHVHTGPFIQGQRVWRTWTSQTFQCTNLNFLSHGSRSLSTPNRTLALAYQTYLIGSSANLVVYPWAKSSVFSALPWKGWWTYKIKLQRLWLLHVNFICLKISLIIWSLATLTVLSNNYLIPLTLQLLFFLYFQMLHTS